MKFESVPNYVKLSTSVIVDSWSAPDPALNILSKKLGKKA